MAKSKKKRTPRHLDRRTWPAGSKGNVEKGREFRHGTMKKPSALRVSGEATWGEVGRGEHVMRRAASIGGRPWPPKPMLTKNPEPDASEPAVCDERGDSERVHTAILKVDDRAGKRNDYARTVCSHRIPGTIQVEKIQRLRIQAETFVRALLDLPSGPDRVCAIRYARSALQTGIAAIVLPQIAVPE